MLSPNLLFHLGHEITDQLSLAREAQAWYGIRPNLIRSDLDMIAVNSIIITYNILREVCYGNDNEMGTGVPMGG